MIAWRCRSCGHRTYVLPEMRGKKVRCPKCKTVGVVPGGVEARVGKLAEARGGERERTESEGTVSKRPLILAAIILAVGVLIAVLLIVFLG